MEDVVRSLDAIAGKLQSSGHAKYAVLVDTVTNTVEKYAVEIVNNDISIFDNFKYLGAQITDLLEILSDAVTEPYLKNKIESSFKDFRKLMEAQKSSKDFRQSDILALAVKTKDQLQELIDATAKHRVGWVGTSFIEYVKYMVEHLESRLNKMIMTPADEVACWDKCLNSLLFFFITHVDDPSKPMLNKTRIVAEQLSGVKSSGKATKENITKIRKSCNAFKVATDLVKKKKQKINAPDVLLEIVLRACKRFEVVRSVLAKQAK